MPNARTTPRANPLDAPRAPSSRPPRSVVRLDEALADAEKMARRVDRILDEDPFAAALLAREYLSLVQERPVNPLNQQGRTDAWTSAFVRLRVAADRLLRHEQREEGEAYLAARAEERRLFGLFGSAPRARLTAARSEARAKRQQARGFRIAAWGWMGAAMISCGVAMAMGRIAIAIGGAAAGALLAVGSFVASFFAARAMAPAAHRAAELEKAIAALSLFETSEDGRFIVQRIQREHPLLVRTSMAQGSSAPPPPSKSGAHRRPE